MVGNLYGTLGELPRMRGEGWGGKRCEEIDKAVDRFVGVWPEGVMPAEPHLFTSGCVQNFIAYEYRLIVSRDSIRRRLLVHPDVEKFSDGHWWKPNELSWYWGWRMP